MKKQIKTQYLPFTCKKDMAYHLNKHEFPWQKNAWCKFSFIWPCGLEKKIKMQRVYGNNNGIDNAKNNDKNNIKERTNFDGKSSLMS